MMKAKLESNRCTLVENGNFRHFRDYIIQEGLLTWEEVETIEAEKVRYQQMSRFLDIMRGKTQDVAKKFLNILQETDAILFSQLVNNPSGPEDTVEKTSTYLDHVDKIQRELEDWYMNTLSRIHPIPWCRWLELDLDHVFTNLQLAPGQKHNISHRLKMLNDTNNTDVLTKVFEATSKRCICYIEGPAGIGKSTLCRHIAYKWANNGHNIFGQHFDVFVILEARSLTKDLRKCLVQELFPEDFEVSEEDIHNTLRTHKSLLIIDGVDELTPDGKLAVQQVLNGKFLRNVHLLITGRPESSPEFIRYANSHLKVKGYSDENMKHYICKYFKHDHSNLETKLLERLDADADLRELAVNPFTTLLLCLLTQDKCGAIPSNSIDIYGEVLRAACRKYIIKVGQNLESGLTEETLFNASCHLAYNGFLNNIFVFHENDLKSLCPGGLSGHVLKSGMLNKDFTVSRLHSTGFCYFAHRSFQEFLCGSYLERLDLNDWKVKLLPLLQNRFLSAWGVPRYLRNLLATQPAKTKIFFESVLEMLAQTQACIEDVVYWFACLLPDLPENQTSMEDLSTLYLNRSCKLVCIFCVLLYHNLDKRIQRAVCKMNLPPVVFFYRWDSLSTENEIYLESDKNHSGQIVFFRKTEYGHEIDMFIYLHLHFDSEVLHISESLLSDTSSLNDVHLPFVLCGSIRSGNELLKNRIKIGVISLLIMFDSTKNSDILTFMNTLTLVKHNTAIVFVILEDYVTDSRVLNFITLITSHKSNKVISYLRLPHTYLAPETLNNKRSQRGPYSLLNKPERKLHRQFILRSSIHREYYERFCPY